MSRSSRVDHVEAVEELHQALTARLSEMTTSEDWLKYSSNARRFHRYSPQNQMLLALQGAGGAWLATAIGLGSPLRQRHLPGRQGPDRPHDPRPDEGSIRRDRRHHRRGDHPASLAASGRSACSTRASSCLRPYLGQERWRRPSSPATTGGSTWSTVFDHLEGNGYDVDLHSRSPIEKWNGQTRLQHVGGTFLIADDLEPAQQLKTLLHEWAHVNLDHGECAACAPARCS